MKSVFKIMYDFEIPECRMLAVEDIKLLAACDIDSP
jgi:hypothetical protein